jgi:hypothetical protein
MGKSITPTYRIEFTENGSQRPLLVTLNNTMRWPKEAGKVSDANLEKYMKVYGKSLEIGGCNEHISKALGHIPYPSAAWVVRQRDNKVVASWKAAMFQVW